LFPDSEKARPGRLNRGPNPRALRDPMDLAILLTLVVSFAVLVTVHVWLAVALAKRKPWWRGPVALIVAPLAPYWGLTSRLRTLSIVWLTALTTYGLSLLVGMTG